MSNRDQAPNQVGSYYRPPEGQVRDPLERVEDPTLRNARREALIIFSAWAAATLYCCIYCYLFGYIRPGNPLGKDDIRPVLGMPSWFFWGVIAPWGACFAFTFWFAGFYMKEDDLGSDHAPELDADIREGGLQ